MNRRNWLLSAITSFFGFGATSNAQAETRIPTIEDVGWVKNGDIWEHTQSEFGKIVLDTKTFIPYRILSYAPVTKKAIFNKKTNKYQTVQVLDFKNPINTQKTVLVAEMEPVQNLRIVWSVEQEIEQWRKMKIYVFDLDTGTILDTPRAVTAACLFSAAEKLAKEK